ncbi:hypothetical protein UY3_12972 [Chelonia mydas]|uniref:Uncharacterized protein n=1 Tax=Chelonia mydas TaxID=8469 RepID=M7BP19_CHEMY|nr:hypothetical protein UY3_12972 [Chelonia mydas]
MPALWGATPALTPVPFALMGPGQPSVFPTGPRDPSGSDGREQPPTLVVSSSSSADEALVGTSVAPALEDSRVLQQLLLWVAQGLGIKSEEVVDDVDPTVDILAPFGPVCIALLLIKTITDMNKTLWQIPAKRNKCQYFVPSKGYEHLSSHPEPDSLVVDAANQWERQ